MALELTMHAQPTLWRVIRMRLADKNSERETLPVITGLDLLHWLFNFLPRLWVFLSSLHHCCCFCVASFSFVIVYHSFLLEEQLL